MKYHPHGTALPFVIIAIALVLGGSIIGVLLVQNIRKSTLDTSDWKTYDNELYGFLFRYPSELGVGASNGGGFYTPVATIAQSNQGGLRVGTTTGVNEFSISYTPRSTDAELKMNSGFLSTPSRLQLSNTTGYLYRLRSGIEGRYQSALVEMPNGTILLSASEDLAETLRDVLKTFTVTTPTTQTAWLTYTNTTHGYAFRYPSTWEVRDASEDGSRINVHPLQESESVRDALTFESIPTEERQSLTEAQEVTINNLQATQGYDSNNPSVLVTTYLREGSAIQATGSLANEDGIHNLILSTFQFTE